MKKIFLLLIIFIIALNCSVFAYGDNILNKTVLSAPGTSESDWSAIALYLNGDKFDTDLYISQLGQYVSQKYESKSKLSKNKSTEWHRIAVAVNLLGADATNFYGINLLNDGVYFRDNLNKQGLNGYIWALITLSSGNFPEPEGALNTKSSLIEEILKSQNVDGGFSLSGSISGCDITSMAVYALSFYKDSINVSNSIDRALEYLASMRGEGGAFTEDGIENCESTAQVIIALSALNFDWKNDGRFSDLTDALNKFRCKEGFSHTYGEEANVMATCQAQCAVAALKKGTAIYSFYNSSKEVVSTSLTDDSLDYGNTQIENADNDIQENTAKTNITTAIESVTDFVEATDAATEVKSKTEIETETLPDTENESDTDIRHENTEKTFSGNYILLILVFLFVFGAVIGFIVLKVKK